MPFRLDHEILIGDRLTGPRLRRTIITVNLTSAPEGRGDISDAKILRRHSAGSDVACPFRFASPFQGTSRLPSIFATLCAWALLVSGGAAAQGDAGLRLEPPHAALSADAAPSAGQPAPPLALEMLAPVGAPVRQVDRGMFAGRVVLVHFFATWCEPCREELPALNRLAARFADRPLTLLAVDVGEVDARVRRFIATTPVAFPILMDRERLAARAWDVSVLPASILVGPEGHVRAQARGPVDWDRAETDQTIATLFASADVNRQAQEPINPPSGGPTQ
jgi:thiol-disulfide isomerase/thioredoxin